VLCEIRNFFSTDAALVSSNTLRPASISSKKVAHSHNAPEDIFSAGYCVRSQLPCPNFDANFGGRKEEMLLGLCTVDGGWVGPVPVHKNQS
jgi:hypothetical protein